MSGVKFGGGSTSKPHYSTDPDHKSPHPRLILDIDYDPTSIHKKAPGDPQDLYKEILRIGVSPVLQQLVHAVPDHYM